MPTKTLRLSLPTPSGTAFYAVTGRSDGTVTDVAATDMSFRHRLARASYEEPLRQHLAELGLTWESEVVAKLTGKVAA
jgi:hypothetical protein